MGNPALRAAIRAARAELKSTELAYLCPDTIDEAATATEQGLPRIGSDFQLCHQFLDRIRLHL